MTSYFNKSVLAPTLFEPSSVARTSDMLMGTLEMLGRLTILILKCLMFTSLFTSLRVQFLSWSRGIEWLSHQRVICYMYLYFFEEGISLQYLVVFVVCFKLFYSIYILCWYWFGNPNEMQNLGNPSWIISLCVIRIKVHWKFSETM